MRLLASDMSCAIEADDVDAAINLHVSDCFECGCCSYVCPSHRPLVQHFRRAKGVAALRKMLQAKEIAEKEAKAKAEAERKCAIAQAESKAEIESAKIEAAVAEDEISKAWGKDATKSPDVGVGGGQDFAEKKDGEGAGAQEIKK